MRNSVIITGIIVLALFVPSKVMAQTYSLSLSPSVVELVIKPAVTATQEYTIINNADPTIATIRVIPMKLEDNGDQKITQKDLLAQSPAMFKIESPGIFLDKPFFLNSNATQKFKLNLNVSKDSKEEDVYFNVLILSHSPALNQANKTQLEPAIFSNLIVSVTSTGVRAKNAEISEFRVPRLIDSFDPFSPILRLKNSGPTYFKPVGTITLHGLLTKSKYDIIPQSILRGTSRILHTSSQIQTSLDSGTTLEQKGFMLGPYSVATEILLDGSKIKLSQKTYLIAFPFKVSGILFIVLAAWTIVRKKRKALSHRKKK